MSTSRFASMAASAAAPAMDVPRNRRPRRTAAARRAQRDRAQARGVQALLRGFEELVAHRGGQPSRLAVVLRAALSVPVAPSGHPGEQGPREAVLALPSPDGHDPHRRTEISELLRQWRNPAPVARADPRRGAPPRAFAAGGVSDQLQHDDKQDKQAMASAAASASASVSTSSVGICGVALRSPIRDTAVTKDVDKHLAGKNGSEHAV